jgi:Domain of unknown function (DUF1844)
MAEEKKDTGFKVSDRRLFTADGELRTDSAEEESSAPAQAREPAAAKVASPPSAAPPDVTTPDAAAADAPAPPTAAEQQAQHDAYRQSSRDLDARVELSGHSAKELEVTFERFMASLYMTAMMQLGLMQEPGGRPPQIDLIGARQTIDSLDMLREKTQGNLTPKEKSFLENCLYELRMAYVEVTNALAHPPQAPGPGPNTGTNG